jgi:phosphatidylglycerophosphate synthase
LVLDALFVRQKRRFWDAVARVVARTGVSPNQVTWASTALLALHCAAFVVHQRALPFAVGVALLELCDELDGAVARVTGTASDDGAYLDAMTDRYKETFVLAAVAQVYGAWPWAFGALSGGLLTSYAKARAVAQLAREASWPDLFERFERVAFVCVLLVVAAIRPAVAAPGLALLALLTHLSAGQRFWRARRLLRRETPEAPR